MKNLNIFSLVAEYENAKSGGVLNVPNVSFVDEDNSVRYLLKLDFTHNGYEYVDLGLPSRLKWATCNVGASSPEQSGLYFAWGETQGYTGEQVKSGVRGFTEEEYNAGPAASISADLTLEQDAAHVNMGGNWRMPTKGEWLVLIHNCDAVWTKDYNGTGIQGFIFTSHFNGKSVFFPATDTYNYEDYGCCYYWLASLRDYNSSYYFWGDDYPGIAFQERYLGLTVRAVCE